ncbi:peptidase S58 DmpA [Desulfarculus baarsii DSM 2075]|uniref:Peptidase S58 DmpA n=1 Tax=Desulfarculus baarsii (strain ATCC 33931 / DSM 2075 / LMG 7858 / VKM B-1802 / 2st14) TaxID=644282 RepID=E1QG82_DESB2|nr:P1 family peptidase [Desulfarculus baarsii]ADK83594.1 peptidase S58 DmpA [Desulfarculus baarsii DSM 2075]
MIKPGRHNAITDVAGLLVGHHHDLSAASGVSVVICPQGAVGGVDVRGSAPGTRETDLLQPENLVRVVNAVALCGGSVYGLAAADGVVRWLAEKGWGFPLEGGQVAPIVPAAALYDLGRGASFVPPTGADWGRAACQAAGDGPVAMGAVGAGCGAMSGGIKGGLGTASAVLASGLTVGALVAVNSLGGVIDPASGRPWEIGRELDGEFGPQGRRAVQLPQAPPGQPGQNTTIGVVATDAAIDKAQAKKLAQMAQDGLARAIRPAHTMYDGDTIFCLGTGQKELPRQEGFFASPQALAITELGQAMADCLARAIVQAVLRAQPLAGMVAFAQLAER